MDPRVRAKFRCLSLNTRYDGNVIVELMPVQQKGVNSKENAEFWSYSPNGNCSLCYYKQHPFKVGAYYYIDMVSADVASPELWKLDYLTRNDGGAAEVSLSWYRSYDYKLGKPEGLLTGNLKIGMEPKAKGAIEAFSSPGSKWVVIFTFAEASDNES